MEIQVKEGGTSLNKTFREYNLVFKGLTIKHPVILGNIGNACIVGNAG